jgi:uncharacterized protein YfaS (alpha-2-macroglobulin family)
MALLVAIALLLIGSGVGAEETASTRGPKGEAVLVGDPEEVLRPDTPLTVSFPDAMVPASEIDVEAKKSPIAFIPDLKGRYIWKSQTEGEFTPDAVPPGTQFKVMLAPGLTDLAGERVNAGKDGEPLGVRHSQKFEINTDFDEQQIDQRPAVALTFSVPIKPADLAESAWFQDRDSRKRYPAEVIVEPDERNKQIMSATVSPRANLPGGRTFDLIVEGLKDAATGTAMKHPVVKALGETAALKVLKVAAFNYPMMQPRISVEFSEEVDPAEGRKIKIAPEVEVKCLARGKELWLEGAFDIHQRYRVTVPAEMTGKRGFAMAEPSVWGASFHAKKPSLIFPAEDLHQRSILGLRFGFMQVNTGPLQWKLARVPPEKLLAINTRLREFTDHQIDPVTGEDAVDPESGLPIWKSSESLIDASRLEMVAQGEIEASPAEMDTRREIAWKPDRGFAAGTYVLEVTGTIGEGKILANRALITFTEYAATQKRMNGSCLLRVTNIGNGEAVPGMRVRAIGEDNKVLAESVTDGNGVAKFDRQAQIGAQPGARWIYLETADGPVLQPADTSRFFESGFDSYRTTERPSAYRLAITSDRPIYRPGQTLKFKGFVREVEPDGTLKIPRERDVTWQVTDSGGTVANGTAKLDGYGGFEGEWAVPASSPVGDFQLGATFHDETESQDFVVQEFRPPPFLVSLADLKLPGAEAGLRISSAYFHGAPNAGAHVEWKALWTARRTCDSGVVIADVPRQTTVQPEATETVKGEGTLTPDGVLEVKVAPPFHDGVARGWYDVEWSAEVTAVDGQTIGEKSTFPVFAVPVELSVTGNQNGGEAGDANPLIVSLDADVTGTDQQPVAGTPLTIELYRALTKSVKEEIAPNVYRYRNYVRYEKDQTIEGHAPLQTGLHVQAPGDYLAVLRDAANPEVPPATSQIYIAGPGEAEFPVRDDQSIGVTCDRKMDDTDPQSGYTPGEKAMISVQAPFSGVAWVSIEAEKVLDTFFLPVAGNSSRFELPIKKEYGPDAWVTVYLLHPGGENRLPAERFGSVRIKVRRPDLALQVTPVLASKEVQPKGAISGQIAVSSEGRAVKGADLTVYAVDEAVLDAGDWHEPHLYDAMYPDRQWTVGTYQGLLRLSTGVDDTSLHQKGFIIGGGGEYKSVAAATNVADLRTNFPPLAYWKTHLETDREGKVSFAFTAPDSLTKYRVIALAQTKAGQFGTGSDWVELSKPVQIEPALPRFLRVGDEVELRVIVRQKIADELPVKVRCTTPLTLAGGDTQVQTVRRGVPAVYRFHATVGEARSVAIRFETDSGSHDAVELTLPVLPPTLLRKEALSGTLDDVRKRIPQDWKASTGTVETMLSTSPWLPKLAGLPLLLEYPHGCFEQITSRILGYTVLADLLAYLPEPAARSGEYRKRIQNGLDQIRDSVTGEGYLPYWPGGKASAYPTVAGYWSLQSAATQGMTVPAETTQALAEATRAIARGDQKVAEADSFCRAFALMVLSRDPAEKKAFAPVTREMYLRRETMDPEVRALLAIAMHHFEIMPGEQQQLLREIDTPLEERGFEPENFGSTTRSEAIRVLAFALLDPEGTAGKAREQLRMRIDDFLDSSQALSTQENFWLLLAFKTMHPSAGNMVVPFQGAQPAPRAISPNLASALWDGMDIRNAGNFAPQLAGSNALTCLMSAQFRTDSPVTARTDNGFRVERVRKNMTDPARTGSAEAPLHLGDEILITYRLISPKLHHFVALEDELPAGLETTNPDIASIARTYSVPEEEGSRQLDLSHSELRDHSACLYFDEVDPGIATYSVLARATCAGVFHWPATQAVPMYDSRFSGLSPSDLCHISGD